MSGAWAGPPVACLWQLNASKSASARVVRRLQQVCASAHLTAELLAAQFQRLCQAGRFPGAGQPTVPAPCIRLCPGQAMPQLPVSAAAVGPASEGLMLFVCMEMHAPVAAQNAAPVCSCTCRHQPCCCCGIKYNWRLQACTAAELPAISQLETAGCKQPKQAAQRCTAL